MKFRLYDVFSGAELGTGLQFAGTVDGWRRMAHKVADAVYSRITGEGGYFDSRVVYVSETGPKDNRQKRLAIMDYDGANVQLSDRQLLHRAGPAVFAHRRPDTLYKLRKRLSADLCAGHRVGAASRTGQRRRHDELCAAFFARPGKPWSIR